MEASTAREPLHVSKKGSKYFLKLLPKSSNLEPMAKFWHEVAILWDQIFEFKADLHFYAALIS